MKAVQCEVRASIDLLLFTSNNISGNICTSRPSTVGDRSFPVAVARVWNTLSQGVISASSLPAFKRRLKTELFLRSFQEVAPTASD